jgi:hypothetical protein
MESYNVTLEAGEEVTITIGTKSVTWTVAAGKTGQFSAKFNEEKIQA